MRWPRWLKLSVGLTITGLPATVLLISLWQADRASRSPERVLSELRMRTLIGALERYAAEHDGQLPTTHEGLRPLLPYLQQVAPTPGLSPDETPWWTALPMDAWGQPFLYFSPGVHVGHPYELVSLGADGKPGGQGEDADLVSWELATSSLPGVPAVSR